MTLLFKSNDEDIFESRAEAWINPVNCVGVMGKGLALLFRQRFPENMQIYKDACSLKALLPGHFLAVEVKSGKPSYIVNLATKDHWRNPSKIDWVAQGAARVRVWAECNNISSVACPALGSGEGGLPWDLVRDALIISFEDSFVEFQVHEPRKNSPKPRTKHNFFR